MSQEPALTSSPEAGPAGDAPSERRLFVNDGQAGADASGKAGDEAFVVVSSVERGRGPRPGLFLPPYQWDDVVAGPPPRRARHGEGSYVVYHTMELDSDTRLKYSTIVGVNQSFFAEEEAVRVDSHLSVQHRLFLEFLAKEREWMRRSTARARERLVRNVVAQRRAAKRLPYAWMRRSALTIVRAEGRVGHWGIGVFRSSSRAFVEFPDAMYTRIMRVSNVLSARAGRRGLWTGLKNPRDLTNEEKFVVLSLSTGILFGLLFLMPFLLTTFLPLVPGLSEATEGLILGRYGVLQNTFVLGVATAVLLPFPPSEALALAAWRAAGPFVAFATITASKVAGAWLVYFIGDSIHEFIEEQTEGKPRLQSIVAWMNRNSQKYGLWVLALFLTVPFLPDTLALYVFAVSGMSFRHYIIGAAIGTAVRYGGVIAIAAWVGPEALSRVPGL